MAPAGVALAQVQPAQTISYIFLEYIIKDTIPSSSVAVRTQPAHGRRRARRRAGDAGPEQLWECD